MDDTYTVAIEADTVGFETAIESLEKQAMSLGDTLAGALKMAVVSGKSFEDILRKIALQMASSFFAEGIKPLQSLLNGLGANLFSGLGGITPFANGGVLGSGGVIATPTYFPLGSGSGLMGEAGPEAIMPLTRGADGRLGVASAGGGGSAQINVTIQTSDAASFKRSEAQVSGAIARAVTRGQRTN